MLAFDGGRLFGTCLVFMDKVAYMGYISFGIFGMYNLIEVHELFDVYDPTVFTKPRDIRQFCPRWLIVYVSLVLRSRSVGDL